MSYFEKDREFYQIYRRDTDWDSGKLESKMWYDDDFPDEGPQQFEKVGAATRFAVSQGGSDRYLFVNQAGDEIIADLTYELPPDNGRILRDINNLVISRLTVNGETFDDVMRIELNAVNITLFVERGKGLQGIMYGGEIYRRID